VKKVHAGKTDCLTKVRSFTIGLILRKQTVKYIADPSIKGDIIP
jgi:hypothetical protein